MNTFHNQSVALCSWPELTVVMEKNAPATDRLSGYLGTATSETRSVSDVVDTDVETGRTVARFDRESVSLSVVVPTLVADCRGVDPCGLPPLYDCIDVDALERVAGRERRGASDVAVSFRYAGYAVSLDGDVLTVQPVE